MNNFLFLFKLAIAVTFGFISYLLGGFDILLETLITLSIMDIITGVMVACVNGQLSSRIAWVGFVRKCGTYIVVAVAVKLDLFFGSDVLRGLVIGFFVGVEGLSILENWGSIGLPLPEKIKNTLKQLKDAEDE